MDISPIFLLGTQRSGTTLLRLIMNAHSQIAIPEESPFLMPLLNKRHLREEISGDALKVLVNYLKLNPHLKLWGYDYSNYFQELAGAEKINLRELISDIYSIYCRGEGKKIWGDKTPSFFRKVDILQVLFPNAKFIHIVRDGRAVFDSWRRMDSTKNYSAAIAFEWAYKLSRIEKSLKQIAVDNQLTIRYEDLLESPEKTVKNVCTFLKVKYEPGMLEFYKTSHNYIGSHHSELIFKPIDKSNMYKWRENMTCDELSSFNLIAKSYLKKYNYPIDNKKRPNLLYVFKSFATGLLRRAIQVLQAKSTLDIAFKKGVTVDPKFIPIGKLPKGKQNKTLKNHS